ncbi:protein secretion-related protein, putative [Cryptococcus deneoformans JEC21]|uniref:Protein secretion-related protein, putative n=1 Tax=Cryptococcus deneoformans (strain JEC21 / ATCC MYA-565) TaxID=214684 RepID=Q5KCV1_CRYD1|nr:protein secretion-related protein, putative [Cryptococcus neoformans var. neoformans JEC21]AAW45100.1 protein secretion-related protein, putative [Cryptococcus neoformans var. neoformans JEC21]
MARLPPLAVLFAALGALAHGDHSFDLSDQADNALSYAERHMHTEHHIDSFDLESFFKLHDLDMNGYWDELEIQAVYGLHHHSLKDKMRKGAQVDARAQNIVSKVLEALDKNQDDHYDEESEYCTIPRPRLKQTSHIPIQKVHHAEIEDEEDARERRFEGLPPTADLTKDHVAADPLDHHEHAPGQGPLDENENPQSRGDGDGDENDFKPGDEVDPPPVRVPKRVDPGAAPQRIVKAGHLEELGGLKQAALEQPGWVGGARPKSAEERLRAGVPYKYKMRKGFRYDEF